MLFWVTLCRPWSRGISLGWEAQRLPGHNRSLILILVYESTSGDSPGPFLLAEWELFHPEKVQSLLNSGGRRALVPPWPSSGRGGVLPG